MTYPSPDRILVVDIETASQHPSYPILGAEEVQLWEAKNAWHLKEGEDASELYQSRAAILAEFGKIVCISAAYYRAIVPAGTFELRVKSFYGTDEASILTAFFEAVNALTNRLNQPMVLAGHNIREFDVPFLCRRSLISKVGIPALFDLQHQKPWELNLLDTLQLWKFGDYKHYSSLALLAHCFGIKSPKADMDGSMVSDTFWLSKDYDAIATYCQQDVITTAEVLHHISAGAIPLSAQVITVNPAVFVDEANTIEAISPDNLTGDTLH